MFASRMRTDRCSRQTGGGSLSRHPLDRDAHGQTPTLDRDPVLDRDPPRQIIPSSREQTNVPEIITFPCVQ